MKNLFKKRTAVLLILSLLISLAASGCGSEKGDGTLKVGVRSDIMNLGYFNKEAGKYYGMEIDLAKKLSKELGYADVEFITVTPETRKDMLLDGKVDCLIAAYSIADKRKENFDFSAPYYVDSTRIMVEKSSLFQEMTDLQNKTIGILAGSNAGPLLAQKLYDLGMITEKVVSNTDTLTEYEGMDVLKFSSYEELSKALEEGVVDAVCTDASIAGTYMNENRKILDLSIAEQQYGVATQKGSKLSGPIAENIQKMLDDGTIEKMIDKWN